MERQNLSFEQLRIYYLEKKKPLNKQFQVNLELLTPQKNINYAGYLLADENNISIKVAKYKGNTRVNLIESNEYGYTSLIKATKSVLDKVNLENRTQTKITAKERIEQRLWNEVAIREAIINAFVHNDYTREIAPKIEIFNDRIEITSAGSLPNGLSEDDFFEGFSIPRNKELMRVFKDLDLVEQLGSGIPRILETYGKECFRFTDNFLRMSFPSSEEVNIFLEDSNQDSNQEDKSVFLLSAKELEKSIQALAKTISVSQKEEDNYSNKIITKYKKIANSLTDDEVAILRFSYTPKKRKEILENCLGISNQTKNFKFHTENLLSKSLLKQTIPDKPTSKFQKYFTTEGGKICLHLIEKNNH